MKIIYIKKREDFGESIHGLMFKRDEPHKIFIKIFIEENAQPKLFGNRERPKIFVTTVHNLRTYNNIYVSKYIMSLLLYM